MFCPLSLLFSIALFFSSTSVALRAPIRRHAAKRYSWPSNAHFLSSAATSAPHGIPLRNKQDIVYSAGITLGGQEFSVQVDTGSSDLWIKETSLKSFRTTSTTDLQTNVTYGKGSVAGPVQFSELRLGDFVVPSQAFIRATNLVDLQAFSDLDGLIGLGFHEGSVIWATLAKAYGDSPRTTVLGSSSTEHIFYQNMATPNFFTFLLGRETDLDGETKGLFTLSEYIPEFAAVAHAPKLPREKFIDPAHWSVLMDGFSINGRAIPLKSRVPSAPRGRVMAALDTGFSFPPIPSDMVDAIYGSIPGAVHVTDVEPPMWAVPCKATTKVVFSFRGVDVPIHPLDLTAIINTTLPDGRVFTTCINTYTPIGDLLADKLDMVLGDAFLRNAYVSFDYGTFDKNGVLTEQPYVQVLPTTQFEEALPEFMSVRTRLLANLPPEVPPAELVKLASSSATASATPDSTSVAGPSVLSGNLENDVNSPSDSSAGSDMSSVTSLLNKYTPVVIGLLAGNIVAVCILCSIALCLLLSRRRRAGRGSQPDYRPLKLEMGFERPEHMQSLSRSYDK